MQFEVGPYRYGLALADLPEDVAGKCCHAPRRIELSRCIVEDELLPTLLHELYHAWEAVLPPHDTGSEEGRAEYHGAVVTMVTRQLQRQGGEAGLRDWLRRARKAVLDGDLQRVTDDAEPETDPDLPLDPWAYLDRPQSRGRYTQARGQRAVCTGCGSVVTAPLVEDGRARFDATAQGWVIDRVLCCPVCGRMQTWVEGVTPWQAPSGVLVNEPVAQPPQARAAWLEARPQARAAIEAYEA